jgi:hypothetical protein
MNMTHASVVNFDDTVRSILIKRMKRILWKHRTKQLGQAKPQTRSLSPGSLKAQHLQKCTQFFLKTH